MPVLLSNVYQDFQRWYTSQSKTHPHFSMRIATLNDTHIMKELINLSYQDAIWFKHPCFHDRVDIKALQKHFDHGFFLLLTKASDIVACVYIEPTHRIMSLSLLSVHPRFQRQGCATYLVNTLCDFLKSMCPTCTTITLNVVSLQTHLLPIYQQLGFEVSGKKKWEDVGVDEKTCISIPCHLITMTKKLDV